MNHENGAHGFTEGAEFRETKNTMNTEKKIHFRIIELPDYQVLLTKDFDSEDEQSTLFVISFFHEGIKADLKMGFKNEEKVDELISKFSDADAQKIIENTLKQFG